MNGAVQKPSFALHGSERIEVEPAPPPPLKAAPEDLPIEILYQDASVIAVNKPAGPVSYTHLRAHETVLDLVCRLLLEKKKQNVHNTPTNTTHQITQR